MKAILIPSEGSPAQLTQFDEGGLTHGDVLVKVLHSTINYKDGLALTGAAPVVLQWPMIPGIDIAGIVEASDRPDFSPGDQVVLNGAGLGETHLGGYAEKARVDGDWLVKLPSAFTPAQAAAIGTAGYTAMLSILAIERHGLSPSDGAVLVTGAAGGVGSVAISLLSRLGWHVIASTGRPDQASYLRDLGAAEIIDRSELAGPVPPLGQERWIAAVDTVGSTTLANVLAQTRYGGAVAACGLAGGMDLPAMVLPFILRNVTLLGIDSVHCPMDRRELAWKRLASDLDTDRLTSMTSTIKLEEVLDVAPRILGGQVRGRIVVDI